MNGTGDMSFIPFVLFTHVYTHDFLIVRRRLVLVSQYVIDLCWRPLRHLLACLSQNLAGCITHVHHLSGLLTKLIYLLSKVTNKRLPSLFFVCQGSRVLVKGTQP